MQIFLIILSCIIAITLVSLVIFFLWLKRGVKALSKDYPDNEIKKGTGYKKVLILYQASLHNTAERVTNTVIDTFLNLGYSITANYISDKLNYDLNCYDFIAFGSPVYVGNISPKFIKYIKCSNIENKKILIYTIGNIDTEEQETYELVSLLKDKNTIYKIKIRPKSSDLQNLISYIKNIVR